MPLREHSHLLRWTNFGNWGEGFVLQVKPSCNEVCRGVCGCVCVFVTIYTTAAQPASLFLLSFFLAFWSLLLQTPLFSWSQNYFCLLLSHYLSLLLQSSATRPYCLCKEFTTWYVFKVPTTAVLRLWRYYLYWAVVYYMQNWAEWFTFLSSSWPSSNSFDDTNQIKNAYLSAMNKQYICQIFRSE